jgi:hypothetical protein
MIEFNPHFNLERSDNNSLTYKLEIPAKNPNSAAGCILLIFGIIPGIAYYLFAKQEARSYLLHFVEEGDTFKLTGTYNRIDFLNVEFNNFMEGHNIEDIRTLQNKQSNKNTLIVVLILTAVLLLVCCVPSLMSARR